MVSRAARAASVAVVGFFLWTTSAMAADPHDPTKIGDNLKGIVQPNVKSFWWIAVVCAAIGIGFARKTSRAAGVAIALAVGGVLIFNPGGVEQMMGNIAQKVV